MRLYEVLSAILHYIIWSTNVIWNQRNWEENMSNSSVITVAADGLALVAANL